MKEPFSGIKTALFAGLGLWIPIIGVIAILGYGVDLVSAAMSGIDALLGRVLNVPEAALTMISVVIVLVVVVMTGHALRIKLVRKGHTYFERLVVKAPLLGKVYTFIREWADKLLNKGGGLPLSKPAVYEKVAADGTLESLEHVFITDIDLPRNRVTISRLSEPSPMNGFNKTVPADSVSAVYLLEGFDAPKLFNLLTMCGAGAKAFDVAHDFLKERRQQSGVHELALAEKDVRNQLLPEYRGYTRAKARDLRPDLDDVGVTNS